MSELATFRQLKTAAASEPGMPEFLDHHSLDHHLVDHPSFDHRRRHDIAASPFREEVSNIQERLSMPADSLSAAGHAMRLAAIWVALGAADESEPAIELGPIPGIPTDQTMMSLPDVSQAYQAAAQVMSTAHTIFESLLQFI